MSDDYLLAGNGAIFVQVDGPNTKPQYLGCHVMEDIDQPVGDLTLLYRPDPRQPNRWLVDGSFVGEGGPVETSIETRLRKVRDYLEKISCPVNLYVHGITCGPMGVFGNYDRSFVMRNSYVTSKGRSQFTSRTPEDQNEALLTFDISAQEGYDVFALRSTKLSAAGFLYASSAEINDLWSCILDGCAGDCGDASKPGDVIIMATSGAVANAASVVVKDADDVISETTADPFAVNENIASIRCFIIGRNATRYLALRGTTDAGAPAEVALSDDGGDTWTNVNVGAVNATYGMGPDSIMYLDNTHIWVVLSGGDIFFSDDGGATWTEQSAGVTTNDLYAISMVDERNGFAVGEANTILKTVDGVNWSAVTGPSAQSADNVTCVKAFSSQRAWIAYDDGSLYYTRDGGMTWNERSYSAIAGTGSINHMHWYNELSGILQNDSSAPAGRIFQTIDGGYSWQEISIPTNVGINAMRMMSPYLAYAVGSPTGGAAMILKIMEPM